MLSYTPPQSGMNPYDSINNISSTLSTRSSNSSIDIVLKEEFICPITGLLMNQIVIADDGFRYEKDAIKTYLLTQSTSPRTGYRIRDRIVFDYWGNRRLQDFYFTYPHEKKHRYLLKHKDHQREVETALIHNKTEDLASFGDFSPMSLDKIALNNFMVNKNAHSTMKHFVGNCIYAELPYLAFKACTKGHLVILKYISQRGFDYNTPYKYGMTYLHYACKYGHKSIVTYLISKGVCLDSLSTKIRSPAYYACIYNHSGIVKILVDSGLCPKSICWKDRNLYESARYMGNADVMSYVLDLQTVEQH